MTPLEELESRWREAVDEHRNTDHTGDPGPCASTALMVERHAALTLGRAIHADRRRARVLGVLL